MVFETKKHGVERRLARKFMESLSKELVGDNSQQAWVIASNTHVLKDALQKSAESLPAGKLRSTLLLILRQENQLNAFISSLQQQIKELSVFLELRGDVILTTSGSVRILETLLSSITAFDSKHVYSHEDKQIILARDPPLYILWALAAMELTLQDDLSVLTSVDDANSVNSSLSSTSLFLLHCLKPWVIGHASAYTAVASLAPLAPIVLKALQQPISRSLGNMKALRALIKEVLGFICIVNSKELCYKVNYAQGAMDTLPCVPLLDGFSAVLQAAKMESYISQIEGLTMIEKFKLLFPLAPELVEKAMKEPDIKISTLADIVKLEFVLLQMIVEVKQWKENIKLGDQSIRSGSDLPQEKVGIIAVNGMAILQTDLILDAILSDFSAMGTLDGEEIDLVRFSLFKALIEGHGLFENTMGKEASPGNKRVLKHFLKKIVVARKLKSSGRSLGYPNDVVEISAKLRVPTRLVDWLNIGELIKDLPDIDRLNSRGLVGWLLHLKEVEFEAVIDRISGHGAQADRSSRDAEREEGLSTAHAIEQVEQEAFFFLDTTGGEKDQGPGQGNGKPKAGNAKSRKSKKRKDGPVLFQRHGHHHVPIKKEGTNDMTDSLSDSSEEDEMELRSKRENQGEKVSAE